MCEQTEPFERALRNNNQEGGVLADGDANANDIQREDSGRTHDPDSLSGLMMESAEEDKVSVWGTDSQCDDPELAEFEMLECQELDAYLTEEEQDFVGLAHRKDIRVQSSSCSKAPVEQDTFTKSREERKSIVHSVSEQEPSASLVFESTKVSRNELNSETDVFVSCLSTISTIDNATDRTQKTDSLVQSAKASQRADRPSHSSEKSTIDQKDVDMNLNSTVHSDDVVSEAQVNNKDALCKDVIEEYRKNNNQRNKAGNAILEQSCGNKHKGLAAEKKSHEESNAKMDKSTQADEATDVNHSPPKTSTKGTQSSLESKAIKKQGSFDNTLKNQNSFEKSLKKQPSFENTFRKQLSFDSSLKKQGSFENSATASSSSLEGRKPWGSPSRPTTPTSPKTTSSSSPKRRLPGSPAKVQGIRALCLERSDSPQRGLGQTVKLPVKTSLGSGIPKPIMPQQKEPEAGKSSPPQKAKNIRPKIITYVRKNPQAKAQVTDGPLEASTLPVRLSSYPGPPAHKDQKVGFQPKSTPVLYSSNLLFDKYRQEMQKAGYHPPGMVVTGMKPPNSTIPQRLSGKSTSVHEDIPEKYLQEVRS